MGRSTSGNVATLLALDGCESHTTLSLYKKDATELHFSTEEFTDPTNAKGFVKGLLISEELVQTLDSETNRVPVTLENVDKVLGLAALAESLNFAVAVIGRFWRSGSTTAWKELYRGEARVLPDATEGDIKLEVLSDLIAAGYCVAQWSLDSKCSFRYKDNFCGATSVATTCSKTRKGPNGCQEHDVETDDFRFGGWEYPDVQPAEVIAPGPPEPGGYEGPCFPRGTLILMADWTEKPIETIVAGDLVLAFDHVTLELTPKRVVGDLQVHRSDRFRIIDRGMITPTPNHKFFQRGPAWIPIDEFRPGDKILRLVRRGLKSIWIDWTIESTRIRELRREISVYNFEVEDLHDYIANRCAVSNRKNEA